jgi:hypothetical protein
MDDVKTNNPHADDCGFALYGPPALCTCGVKESLTPEKPVSVAGSKSKRTLIDRLEWPQGESLFDLLKDARSVLTDMPDDVLGQAALAYSALRIERIGKGYYVYDEREVQLYADDGIIGVFSDIVDANRLLVKLVLMEAQAVWRLKR